MTVSSLTPVNNYTGNGSVTIFDFDFLIENQEELVVTHTDRNGFSKVLDFGIDYSINEIGNENGSYITFPLQNSLYSVLSQDEIISLSLNLPIKQESKFANSAYLNLSVLEKTFDYIVRILQILNRKIERSIKTQEGSDVTPDSLMKEIKEAESNTSLFSKTCEEYVRQAQLYSEESLKQANQAQMSANTARETKDELIQGNMYKYQLFDVVSKDNILSFSEKQGFELLGSYVYKNALAGVRYGYPDFYNKCVEEMQGATLKEIILGDTTISMYVNSNGHQFYNIQDKDIVDAFYETCGSAWFYGVDTENECIFLPRYDYVSLNIKDKIPVVGNGNALGLLGDGTTPENTYLTTHIISNNSTRYFLKSGKADSNAIGAQTSDNSTFASASSRTVGVTTVPEKSGIETVLTTFASEKYYYMVVGNVKTTDGYSDVIDQGKNFLAQINEAISNKVDINSSTIDGQWVAKQAVLTQAVTAGETAMDVSEYLPNDGYQYEVFLLVSYGDDGANKINIYSDIIPKGELSLYVSPYGYFNGCYMLLPVGLGRVIYQNLSAAAISDDTRGIEALAYRRIGTNQ